MHLHQYSFSGWSCAKQCVHSCTGESPIQHEIRKSVPSQNPTTLENVPHVLLGEIVSRNDVDVANASSHEDACNVTRDLKPSSTTLPWIGSNTNLFLKENPRRQGRLPRL
ncbi:unnamed protein product [Ectocarpus sp. 13 AM-2016]